jgi:hypothetical protein
MSVRVDLKKWGGENLPYIAAWIIMGTILFVLLLWRLKLDILIWVGPFIPYFIITLARIRQELKG